MTSATPRLLGHFFFFSCLLVRNAILAIPNISITEIIETSYSTEDYLTISQPLINASTNIYIIIIPNPIYFKRFVATASVSGGYFTGSKTFWYLNADVPTAKSTALQGGMIFGQTDGSPANVTAWAAKTGITTTGAATTYDAVWAIADAITRLKTANTAVTRAALVSELKNTNENRFSGPFSFDSNGYREVQTYNISNIFVKPTAASVATVVTGFTWDGTLHVGAPVRWPGSALTPTPGNILVYPVGFISAMYDSYNTMVANDNVVPLTVTQHRLLTRFAQALANSAVLAPHSVQISVPPLNDNGTVAGAVRISTTISQTTYVGMIATWDSPNTRIIQGVLSAYSVPQLSYSATDPTLNSRTTYPTLVRVNPSDSKQIFAMLRMFSHFGWSQVSTISTSSTYGQGLDQSFADQLTQFPDVELGRSIVILEDGTGLSEGLKILQDRNVNIVVLLVEPKIYPKALAAMRDLEYSPRAVVVPDRFFNPYIWQHKLNNTNLEISDFKGWIGVSAAAGAYAGAAERFGQLESLIIANQTTYSGLLAAFYQSPDYVASVVDCFYVMATAIANSIMAGEDPKCGTCLMRHLANVSVDSATGPISFDSNLGRKLNPFIARYVTSEGNFTDFATWDENTGYIQTARVVWPDGTQNIPIAIQPRTVKWLRWDGAAGIVLAAFAGFGMLLVLSMTILVVVWRDSPVIVSSTYPFLLIILFGAGLGFGSMFTWIGEPRTWICGLRIWLPPIAFTLMLAPLLAKTWRLHRIFTLASLKTTPIPLWKLILMVLCLTLIQVGICVAWISAGTVQPTTINDANDPKTAYRICSLGDGKASANRVASYVTYGYLGLLLLIGAYYAFRVRNLPKDFNESRWIGFSIYNTILFSVIIVILGYALTDFRVTVLILICVCTLAIVFGIVGLMMAPKLWTLIMNPHRRSGSGSGTLTYSGPNSSPHGSKYQTSFHSDKGNGSIYDGNSSPRGHSSANGEGGARSGDRSSSNPGRRHDFSRKRGEQSAHSKDGSKDRSSKGDATEMKPLAENKRGSKKTQEKASATSSSS